MKLIVSKIKESKKNQIGMKLLKKTPLENVILKGMWEGFKYLKAVLTMYCHAFL